MDQLCAAFFFFFFSPAVPNTQFYSGTRNYSDISSALIFQSHCRTHDLDIMAKLWGLCAAYDLVTDCWKIPQQYSQYFQGKMAKTKKPKKKTSRLFFMKTLESRGDIKCVSRCVKEPRYRTQSHFRCWVSLGFKLHFNFTCDCSCGKSVNKRLWGQ